MYSLMTCVYVLQVHVTTRPRGRSPRPGLGASLRPRRVLGGAWQPSTTAGGRSSVAKPPQCVGACVRPQCSFYTSTVVTQQGSLQLYKPPPVRGPPSCPTMHRTAAARSLGQVAAAVRPRRISPRVGRATVAVASVGPPGSRPTSTPSVQEVAWEPTGQLLGTSWVGTSFGSTTRPRARS